MRIIVIFFSSSKSLRAGTFFRNVGWGGHNSTVEVTMSEVWAKSVQSVARDQPSNLFRPWAHLRQMLGLSRNPRGLGFCIPYPRVRT